MNTKKRESEKLEIFKFWKNKSWSVFSSIGKRIAIAMLPLSYFLMFVFSVQAQQIDTLAIENVQIVSSPFRTSLFDFGRVIYVMDKEEISSVPADNLQELLEYVAAADIRQRGSEGMQADVSIRGGNPEQTLILLNGFKMNDGQTGHHNLNLPVDIESIERIEILQGPGSRIFGINAYSGAINFITDSQTQKRLKASFFAGQHSYFGGNIGLSYNIGKWQNYASVSGKKSQGYLPKSPINNTDFEALTAFYQGGIETGQYDFAIQAGYTDKSFGANSFYTPKYPWQFENTKTFFAGYKSSIKLKKTQLTHQFSWRRHYDRFELFRESKFNRKGNYFVDGTDTAKFVPGIYEAWNYYAGHNYHRTDKFFGELKFDFSSLLGQTSVGAEYGHDFIHSNVLGEKMNEPKKADFSDDGFYTKSADRYNINTYAQHLFNYRKFMISGGISANYNNNYAWVFTGGADVSYRPMRDLKIYASVNRGVRMPTFTDLYYAGPVNVGNPDLKPETALTGELGARYFSENWRAELFTFYRMGNNTIDWAKLSPKDKWKPLNITELKTLGVGINADYIPDNQSFLRKISISCMYMDAVKQSGKHISRYALDYLKNKALLGANLHLWKNLFASLHVRFEQRNGSYSVFDFANKKYLKEADYEPFVLVDLKLYYIYKYGEFFIKADNLLNTQYHDFGNLDMPGIWVKAGVKFEISPE